MCQFHTDDYIDFLSRVTPENMDAFVKEQSKCMFETKLHLLFFYGYDNRLAFLFFSLLLLFYYLFIYLFLQLTWVMTVLYSTDYLNIVQYLQVDLWVCGEILDARRRVLLFITTFFGFIYIYVY